ncbi:MAG: TonB-dependent receptor, partial [Planctomycetota bacterium]
MLSTTKKAVISVVMALSCSVPIWAQIAGGSIVGNVLDPSSAAIAGASVTATNVDSNQPFGTKTNDVGYYEFPLLPTGRYVVEVQQAGFQNAKTAELFLHAGTQPKIDFHLTLATVAQKVEVSARAPLVNSTTTEVGTVVDNSKVDAMPLNGRSFRQLLDLEAGVVNNPVSSVGGRGGLEVQGSPAFGNNMLLDGVDMSFGENNAVASDAGAGGGGYLITTVSIDAIQEFKVTAGAYSAEYGRATGSVVNLTSKSGTNKFHGRLFEFLRNDKLDANSFFNNASGLPKSALRWNQFGGNIGGPIRRDRVFFFFNYEGAVVHSPAYASGNVPSPLLLSLLTPPLQSYLKA